MMEEGTTAGSEVTPRGEEYTTNINELISQPVTDSMALTAAHYIFSSLYELSSYLFTKKFNLQGQDGANADPASFNEYLLQMGEELGKFGKARANRGVQMQMEAVNMESELVRCYQKVANVYFEEKYFLDFSHFELFYQELKSGRAEGRRKVDGHLEALCESLDLVEVNLFTQIHCKFHEYFAVAANFEYLQDSVGLQLRRLAASRSRIQRVKHAFVDKSVRLRSMIVQRQNIERLLKTIRTVKSLKKLPQVMESILASSLPYECLELLEQTKSSLDSLQNLKCLTNTADSVRQMEVLAQNDLTKRYASELYLYLEECHNRQFVNLEELWTKIEVRFCLDKESSLVIDELNSSTNSALSENPQVLDDIELLDQIGEQQIQAHSLMPRHEGREYQIAMILLQSYQYVNFSPEVTKIKVCNALRLFAKRFEKELVGYLNIVVQQEINSRNQKESSEQATDPVPSVPIERKEEELVSSAVIEKVSVEFYVKHLAILNDIFKETVNRFLGYLQTLIAEYEEELSNGKGKEESRQENQRKFRTVFAEECSLLPSIFKIIEEKTKYLLTLKNISSISAVQFYQWISTFKYWQRYFDYIQATHPLLVASLSPSHPAVQQLKAIVVDNIGKAIAAMGLNNLLLDLTVDYIDVFHKNTLANEIITTLQEDTWQSTEIPPEFSDILATLFHPDEQILNGSLTILDSSASRNMSRQSSREISRESSRELSREERGRAKFKLLKNNILVGGTRYKVSLSFLVLCETMESYIQMGRVLGSILQTSKSRIQSHVYTKIYDLMDRYCAQSKELILDTKALKYEKIKGKSINAKHICLLCNCLSVVLRIGEELLEKSKIEVYGVAATRIATLNHLETLHSQLIGKLSTLLNFKIDKEITEFISNEKTTAVSATKTNNAIITLFLQMVEVTDEYLDIESIKRVLKAAFQTLSQKYFTHLLLKGPKTRGEVEVLAEKLKFMKKYFPLQYDALLAEIPQP